MDWNLILNIAVGMTCGLILMDALRIVFFILAKVVFLLRLLVDALVDAMTP